MATQHATKAMIATGCVCDSCSLMRRVYHIPLPPPPRKEDYLDALPYITVLTAVRDWTSLPWWKLAAITGVRTETLRQIHHGRYKRISPQTAARLKLTLPDLLPETRDLV